MKPRDLALAKRVELERAIRLYALRVPLEESPAGLWGFRRLERYGKIPEKERTGCHIYKIQPSDLDKTYFMLRWGQEWARPYLESFVRDWHDETDNSPGLFRAQITCSPLLANAEGRVLIDSGTHAPDLVLPNEDKFAGIVRDFLLRYNLSPSDFDKFDLNGRLEVARAALFDLSWKLSIRRALSED
jgi:hypothetical protein